MQINKSSLWTENYFWRINTNKFILNTQIKKKLFMQIFDEKFFCQKTSSMELVHASLV